MTPPRGRTTTLARSGMRFDDGPLVFVTVVINAVLPDGAEAALRSRAESNQTAHLDRRDPYQLYRRVVVPAAELLREALPEPDI
jgi:hypothetical protein